MCKDMIFLTNRQIIIMNISVVYITILDEAWFIQLPHYILINNINTNYNILHNKYKVGIYDIWNNSTTPPYYTISSS